MLNDMLDKLIYEAVYFLLVKRLSKGDGSFRFGDSQGVISLNGGREGGRPQKKIADPPPNSNRAFSSGPPLPVSASAIS